MDFNKDLSKYRNKNVGKFFEKPVYHTVRKIKVLDMDSVYRTEKIEGNFCTASAIELLK